ncbi:hypothetical protein BDV19DRAFT_366906 [Aspergillus venezuelensis]
MSLKRLKPDQLWHFFCPALNPARTRNSAFQFSTNRSSQNIFSSPRTSTSQCLQRRYNSTNNSNAILRDPQLESTHIDGILVEKPDYNDTPKPGNVPRSVRRTAKTRSDILAEYMALPTEALEGLLVKYAEKSTRMTTRMIDVKHILDVLLRHRGVKPETRYYKALILCNCDPGQGSASHVQKLLAEMEEIEVPIDSETLHAALRALAVHPDYELRENVLRQLRDRWMPLTPDGWHSVVAGLTREHQFELALDHIANMEKKGIEVKDWLHSLLVYYLCEVKELDPVLQLMESRMNQGHEMTEGLWKHVLRAAAHENHHAITSFVWKNFVELGVKPPGPELCSQILNVAANYGDVQLAASVRQMIQHHSETSLKSGDCETMFIARLTGGDLEGALDLLCELHQEKHTFKKSSIESILGRCLAKKVLPGDAWSILREFKETGRKVPLLCARIVVDSCTRVAHADPFAVDDGIAFYKELHTLCDERPSLDLFNSLLKMARTGNNAQAAMFFVKEMAALHVLPDSETFQHLIVMCLKSGNYQSARLYLDDLHKQNFRLSHATRAMLRIACANSSEAAELNTHPAVIDTRATAEKKEYNKKRRKEKRRRAAIAQLQKEQGSAEFEPSLSTPSDLLEKSRKIEMSVAETRGTSVS